MPAKSAQYDTSAWYPRTYEVGGRRVLNGIAISIACFGAVAPILRIITNPRQFVSASDVLVPLIVFSGFALVWAWWANQRVILDENAVELRTWFSTRKFSREQIAGYRIQRPKGKRGAPRYILIPHSSSERPMKFPPLLRYDKAFYAWMKSIDRVGH